MERPTVLRFGTYRFPIRWSTKKAEQHLGKHDSTAGISLLGEQRILMRTDMGHDVERETLLHEALHCAIAVTRLELDEDMEERLVGGLAPQLLNLLRQCPELVTYVQEESGA